MKKMGFTLAEVLITLSIIGVISALTIPQFTANVHNQSNASKLSPIVTDYENIFGMMLLREDRESIFEADTPFGSAMRNGNINNIAESLKPYTKIVRSTDSLNALGYNGNITTINNSVVNNIVLTQAFGFISIPSGAVLMLVSPTGTEKNLYSRVYIDVNGSTAPNKYGRDIFAFCLSGDGHLYPFGSQQAALLIRNNNSTDQTWNNASSSNQELKCTGAVTGYNGLGCTARLIENNYKVDY